MSDVNPYQSPKVDVTEVVSPPAEEPGFSGKHVWRQGKLLVMRKDAVLPERCVLSNLPADDELVVKQFKWHPLPPFEAFFRGWLIGALFLWVQRNRKAIVKVPVNAKCQAGRRRKAKYLLVLQMIGHCIPMTMAGLALLLYFPCPLIPGLDDWMWRSRWVFPVLKAGLYFGAGLMMVVFSVMIFSPSVTLGAKRIRGDVVWLRGANRDYLARLPEWPGE